MPAWVQPNQTSGSCLPVSSWLLAWQKKENFHLVAIKAKKIVNWKIRQEIW